MAFKTFRTYETKLEPFSWLIAFPFIEALRKCIPMLEMDLLTTRGGVFSVLIGDTSLPSHRAICALLLCLSLLHLKLSMDLAGFGMQPTGTKLLSKMVCSDQVSSALHR